MKRTIEILAILVIIAISSTACDKLPFGKKKEEPVIEILMESESIIETEETTIQESEPYDKKISTQSSITSKRTEREKETEADIKLIDDVVNSNFEIIGGVRYTMNDNKKDVYYEEPATEKPFDPSDNVGNIYTYKSFTKLNYGTKKWNDTYYIGDDKIEYAEIVNKEYATYEIWGVQGNDVIWVVNVKDVNTEEKETTKVIESEENGLVRSTREKPSETSRQRETDKTKFEDFDNVKFKETTTKKKTEQESDPNILTYEQKYPYLYNFKFETKKFETPKVETTRAYIETKSNAGSIAKTINEGTTNATTVALQANSKKAKIFNIQGYTIKANSATEVMYVDNNDNNKYMSLSFGSNSILLSKIQNKSRLTSIYGPGIISIVDPSTLSSSYAMELKEYDFVPDNSKDRIFSHAILKIDNNTSLLILNESGMKDGSKLAGTILKNVEISMK